ncbi:cytosol aminopeptidase family, catalytic domain-containing protein [Fimicolochytrium jonesii]|uniref:cytosol aminopeptidase family, catalytic domain-containing protein n=1 Tax=Fimicolochytrium jonesii TaxID=1396493 RepID=UPI0022FEB483|nr:cytosol aminopeptidase family, catalytic domain-containing protein [Fimicolochytrium jonesii]KAI8822492.1 cytosol aminopeptidase family, catalytic domain-containing protein [Fimicolochytrium jonesii]
MPLVFRACLTTYSRASPLISASSAYLFRRAMSATTLRFGATSEPVSAVVAIGERSLLASSNASLWKAFGSVAPENNEVLVEGKADVLTSYTKSGDNRIQHTFAHLSKERSRNMGKIRSDLVHDLVAAQTPKEGDVKIVLALENQEQVLAAGCAVARAFPLYSKKSSAAKLKSRTVHVEIAVPGGVEEKTYTKLNNLADSIRLASRLMDTPCGELHVTKYVEEIKEAVANLPTVKMEVITGEELKKNGYGGLYGVGKAAEHPPALVVLTHTPKIVTIKSRPVIVGKGIVYDTGGLSLKTSGGMVGMKDDMGGSAACLGAFITAAKENYGGVFTAVLCLAENAIGPKAQRPDDIIILKSGKSVEINNTDAEGRLVLGDGVAYASSSEVNATHIIDIATLTGAQLITTGKKHAAVLSRDEDFERHILDAGQRSGDWCFPILYAPELLKKEFDSKVADMKNSVADRMNAQSSAAGHFVEDHLNSEYTGKWAHVDMAGPSGKDQRGTGFGVALLFSVLESI